MLIILSSLTLKNSKASGERTGLIPFPSTCSGKETRSKVSDFNSTGLENREFKGEILDEIVS